MDTSPQPALLWSQFDALCQIPRPSKKERCVQTYLCAWARLHGFAYRQDRAQPDCGNVVIYVPGRGTGVNAASIIIQSHTDMVCVKDENVAHDFDRDAIQTRTVQYTEADGAVRTVLMATGTTLGADNGIGVSAALAAAIDPALTDCPPLELLFTVDEETGLTGAGKLDATLLHSRLLLNLDSEDLGEICISCAGGRDMIARWPLERAEPAEDEAPVRIFLNGLPGGHSGVQIHERRGNAIVMLLEALRGNGWQGVRLGQFSAGSARNVIPSDAEITLWVTPERLESLELQFQYPLQREMWQNAVERGAREVACGLERLAPAAVPDPLSAAQSATILDAILAVPTGVQTWSAAVEGLVETSNNVAVVRSEESELELICSTRSSREGAIQTFQTAASETLHRSGATVTFSTGYPGWEADPNNPLLALAEGLFNEILGRAPSVIAIHAGLECGVLKGHLPDLQMISFGPDIRGAHTTLERVWIESVPPFYACLTRLLSALAKPA
jgi:dipeptidase D